MAGLASASKGLDPRTMPKKADAPETGQALKHFVLDTNVLLHNPEALYVFQEHHVVIPYPVIEELDTMKRREDDVGRSARECIRRLDRLRAKGGLTEGVQWGTLADNSPSGTIRIDVNDYERPPAIAAESPDNKIIAVAWHLFSDKRLNAVFVSKDLGARIKSDSLGIRTEDFENQKIDADRIYTGYLSAQAGGDLIDELYREKMLGLDAVSPLLEVTEPDGQTIGRELQPNQFLILHDSADENHTGLASAGSPTPRRSCR